jgi:tetratricopeptide (TPR) repeat protein
MAARNTLTVCMLAAMIFRASAAPLLDEANREYAAGKWTSAVRLYKQAAGSGENPALCYFNAANAWYQMDSLARALVYYRATIDCAPAFFKAYLNLAAVYYSLNDMGDCIACVRRGIKLEPANQKALLILAAAYRKSGALAQSIDAFETLARRYPDMEEPYVALGEMYRDLDDGEMAVRWLLAYPSSGRNLSYVYSLLAGLYETGSDINRALYYLDLSFARDNGKRGTLLHIAQLQRTTGNDLVALETARDGMRRFPDFPDLALIAGSIAFDHGWLDEAERCFSVAAQHGSANAVIGIQNVKNRRAASATVR